MRKLPLLVSGLLFAAAAGPLFPQFNKDEIDARSRWEDFLRTARITDEEQLGGPDAVTKPWKFLLEKDGTVRSGLWKDVEQGDAGIRDFWKFEIAAYLLDGLLELNMIPPTVERRYQGRKGSLQIWLDDAPDLKKLTQQGLAAPPDHRERWNRTAFIERAFDSFIGNEDRNANNILVTADWRMILIDHSRSFRSAGNFIERLMFGENGFLRAAGGGPYPIWPLPRAFVEKFKALDPAAVKKILRPLLTPGEIDALFARRTLILAELAAAAQKWGKDKVLYE